MRYQRLKLHLRRQWWKMRGAKIASNSFICKGTEITNPQNLSLSENTILYKNITIYMGEKGSFSMGRDSHIAPFGYYLIDNNTISFGNHVAIGPFCSFFCHTHTPGGDSDIYSKNYTDASITIGNNVFIGSHSVILPGTIIKDNVVIAANSVVNGILEGKTLYGGSPAKPIKSL